MIQTKFSDSYSAEFSDISAKSFFPYTSKCHFHLGISISSLKVLCDTCLTLHYSRSFFFFFSVITRVGCTP